MDAYFINKEAQFTGEHEVHKSNCTYIPATANKLYLGIFSNCDEALNEASKYYKHVDGCYFCSKECHKK